MVICPNVQVIDIAKGPLNKEEFDLVSQNMQGTCSSIVIASDGVKDKFEHISRNFVTWRYATRVSSGGKRLLICPVAEISLCTIRPLLRGTEQAANV